MSVRYQMSTRTPANTILSRIKIRTANVEDVQETTRLINSVYQATGRWTSAYPKSIAGRVDRIDTNEITRLVSSEDAHGPTAPLIIAELPNPYKDNNRIVGCIWLTKLKIRPKLVRQYDQGELTSSIECDGVSGSNGGPSAISFSIENLLPVLSERHTYLMTGLFAVHPTYQSVGLGRTLIDAAYRYAKEEWGCDIAIGLVAERRHEHIAWLSTLGLVWDGKTTLSHHVTKENHRLLKVKL